MTNKRIILLVLFFTCFSWNTMSLADSVIAEQLSLKDGFVPEDVSTYLKELIMNEQKPQPEYYCSFCIDSVVEEERTLKQDPIPASVYTNAHFWTKTIMDSALVPDNLRSIWEPVPKLMAMPNPGYQRNWPGYDSMVARYALDNYRVQIIDNGNVFSFVVVCDEPLFPEKDNEEKIRLALDRFTKIPKETISQMKQYRGNVPGSNVYCCRAVLGGRENFNWENRNWSNYLYLWISDEAFGFSTLEKGEGKSSGGSSERFLYEEQ